MAKSISNGVWPTMVTPYTEKNTIDWDGVLQLIEWYTQQNVSGIFAVCQSSEMFYLSREERLDLIRFIIKNKPKKINVIASGHVAESIDDQIRDAYDFIDSGIDAFVFISNQFAKPEESEEIAKNRIEYLIEHIQSESFGIYECPYPYKRLVSPSLLAWCAATGKFGFLKDTSCDLSQLHAKISAVSGTPLKVFNANAVTLLESLKMGAGGYSGVMANFHARYYSWLCSHFIDEPEKASRMQNLLGMASLAECQYYPVNAKYHLELEGLDINLFSRVQDFSNFPPNRQLEIEQLRATVDYAAQLIMR